MNGHKCIIFSAPSGAGKTTIVHHLLEQNFPLEFSISACSRLPRNNEIDGKDYYFLNVTTFKEKISKNAFIEWEEVYPEHFYGTLKEEVERIWNKGKAVIFDVDVIGGLNLKKQFGKQALAIFVQAPSLDELKTRLSTRNTDTPEKIELRINKASNEMKYAAQFDCILTNDKLENAFQKAEEIVSAFLNKS
jgi:guanylate kinase